MFEQILARLAEALTKASIPYMLIGGQAVLLYGVPRLTKDIDVTLGVDVDQLAAVERVVAQLGFSILVDDADDFVAETYVLPAGDRETGIRIDFIFSRSDYERQALGRAREVKIMDATVRFAAPEDVIIHKIIAGRAVDLEDVRAILHKTSDLDRHYLTGWLRRFDEALAGDYARTFEKIEEQTGLLP